MNRTLRCLSAAALALSIAACGNASEEPKPPPPKETVFDDMIATKERAKQQTEQAMKQNKENLEAAMKKAEEPGAAQ